MGIVTPRNLTPHSTVTCEESRKTLLVFEHVPVHKIMLENTYSQCLYVQYIYIYIHNICHNRDITLTLP